MECWIMPVEVMCIIEENSNDSGDVGTSVLGCN